MIYCKSKKTLEPKSVKIKRHLDQLQAISTPIAVIDVDSMKVIKSLIFNANHLASGVYYYQIQTNASSETRKMILLR